VQRGVVLERVKLHPEGVTRSLIAVELGKTYDAARYWLERLVEENIIRKDVIYGILRGWRRIRYYPVAVKRAELNLYIIIEEGEHLYLRKYGTRHRFYPKGKFQGTYQLDVPVEGEVSAEVLKRLKRDFVEELYDEFHSLYEDKDVTVGETNIVAVIQKDVGKPLVKVKLERVVEQPVKVGYHPKRSWERTLWEYI